ncbi:MULTISPECIES: hypothetical protein [unclassified Enterobacter]|nr:MULTISPECIES: hypothetical protein [unclassified Enterobacter]EWG68202.1 hypothetical protein P348_03434 [Enterobacter sp. DC3]EWG74877.1 hypothetical protein P349_02241 [Enterobacter sp. DC4]
MVEIYLDDIDVDDIKHILQSDVIEVFIPLESVGFSSSYFDLCDDYLEAIWAGERLASTCQHARAVSYYNSENHKSFIKLSLTKPNEKFHEALRDCIILYKQYDGSLYSEPPLEYSKIIDAVISIENDLDNFNIKVPALHDFYYANLIGGKYFEMMSDVPDEYRSEINKYPERALGFWKSAYSSKIGDRCYTSPDAWILPNTVDINNFFKVTEQNYNFESFIPSSIVVLKGVSYTTSDVIISYFPMNHYFKSKVCSSIELSRDEYRWPPDPFDWSNSTFTYSPYNNFLRELIDHDSSLLSQKPTHEQCYVDPNGTLVIVDDGNFYHLLYDTAELKLSQIKNFNETLGEVLLSTGINIGFSAGLTYNWSEIDDEQFEQLCYDIIYSHPRFNNETIRKLGKSRSRDGGRDIQVYDIPTERLMEPKKWIFQCKLVTGAGSLSATKLTDVGDMLDSYDVEGFGVFTNTIIDATLYDKLDKVCSKRNVEQLNFSALEIEKELIRKPYIRMKYFK